MTELEWQELNKLIDEELKQFKAQFKAQIKEPEKALMNKLNGGKEE